jgi:hypothetical protein
MCVQIFDVMEFLEVWRYLNAAKIWLLWWAYGCQRPSRTMRALSLVTGATWCVSKERTTYWSEIAAKMVAIHGKKSWSKLKTLAIYASVQYENLMTNKRCPRWNLLYLFYMFVLFVASIFFKKYWWMELSKFNQILSKTLLSFPEKQNVTPSVSHCKTF